MLITDEDEWSYETFHALVEGMRLQIAKHPSKRIPFLATSTPLSILTLFAIWKEGKIACPLNPKIPLLHGILNELQAPLFTPKIAPPALNSGPMEWRRDQLATFIQTSGSTSKPKIACHTLNNHLRSAEGSFVKIPLISQSRWALTLPLFHVGGIAILFRAYLAKATILLTSSLETATHLSCVPTQLFRLLRAQTPLPHLQTILLGGAPLPKFSTSWKLLPTYGMTEMSSQIVTDDFLHPYAEMTIATDQEIWVRGEVLFQGYLQDDLSILSPLNPSGWFETKDRGEWKNGVFHIYGRKDNLFISGGENIQPEEIEHAICTYCGQEEAVVIPLKDPEFGTRPGVYLKNPSDLPFIQQKLLDILPKFKIPIQAFSLPLSPQLKPNRKKLIQQAKYTETN